MADSKLTALTAILGANVANDDLLYIVDLSAGASGSKKIEVFQFGEYLKTILLSLSGSAFVIIGGSTSSTTNGTNLVSAYAAALTATPQGAALSATNRFSILLLPGTYTVTSAAFDMSAQFIDLIGLGTSPNDVRIESTGKTVVQTASDVTIQNLTIFSSVATPTNNTDNTGYFPTSDMTLTKCIDVYFRANNSHAAMRPGITYSGYFKGCICDVAGGFGCSISTSPGIASGTFIDCIANSHGFGSTFLGSGVSTASGVFINCHTAGGGFGMRASASGDFYNCRTGLPIETPVGSFSATTGGGFGGNDSAAAATNAASGDFFSCICASGNGFGAGVGGGNCSGIFHYCTVTAGDGFGAASTACTFSGTANYCSASGRGFGAGSSAATFSGTARFCSFATTGIGWTTLTGTIHRCKFGGDDWDDAYTPNAADSSAISNTTSETNFSVNHVIEQNNWQISKSWRVTIIGKYSVAANTNAQFRLKLGTTNIIQFTNIALTAGPTNDGWMIQAFFTCRSIGATGTIVAGGTQSYFTDVNYIIPGNGTVTINTTNDQTLQLSMQMSVANAGNTFTLEQFIVEPLGPN